MYLKSLLFLIAFSCSSAALASSDSSNGPTSNIIKSLLNTIYEGKHVHADDTMGELAFSYREFLRDFVYEPYCDDQRLTGLESACKQFQKEEIDKLNGDLWSATYRFNKAEFGPRFSSYNFVRNLPLIDNFLCKITLQISFDLKTKNLINREYWARCD
jgi:hypothetical protein